jgi:hypothetical protein
MQNRLIVAGKKAPKELNVVAQSEALGIMTKEI